MIMAARSELAGRIFEGSKLLTTYARVVGVLLILLGLAGFVGLLETVVATNLYHASVGLFFVYLGFWQRDPWVVRRVVGGMGLMLLLVKAVTTVTPLLWGGPLLLGPIEMTCFVVGVLSIAVARLAGDEEDADGI